MSTGNDLLALRMSGWLLLDRFLATWAAKMIVIFGRSRTSGSSVALMICSRHLPGRGCHRLLAIAETPCH
jgi:hypothetical protein